MTTFLLILTAILVSAVVVTLIQRRSCAIDTRRPVANAGHKFGEAATYYRGTVIDRDGTECEALFTGDQLAVAIGRAQRNPEDVA